MKNTASFIITILLYWIVCLSSARASNFSLIKDYKLIIDNQTEIKIREAESQPLPGNKVNISISNNTIIIKDTTDKALVFSVGSKNDSQVLILLKEKCLDNLANAYCLDEFIEKFYTLFDPFGLEYQYFSKDGPMLAKLVKDEPDKEIKVAYLVSDYLYLQNPDKISGPVKIYEISSGREVLFTNIRTNESPLDLSSLKRGSYVLVCKETRLKFIK